MHDHSAKFSDLREFPGWDKSADFIKNIIAEHGMKVIADVGGGRLPRIGIDFLRTNGLKYHLVDISADELSMADPAYHKIVMDVACGDSEFEKLNLTPEFDLVFSHMLLEHLRDPMQAHRNFYRMLKPGGYSVHMFPSKNNLPLLVNGLIPEAVSSTILKVLQPNRQHANDEGKFEAYYRHCGAPTETLRKTYEQIGFEVVRHTSYIGHEYYKRIPGLRQLERAMRGILSKAQLPIISANLLILRKPNIH